MPYCLNQDDILTEILSKLPVKSIIQCRCVCKSWNSLISSSSFATRHLERTENNTDLLFFKYKEGDAYSSNGKERFFLYPDDGFLDFPSKELSCPYKPYNSYLDVLGCVNGVVCLSDNSLSYTNRAAFWNPSIRKIVVLPLPNVTFLSHGPYELALGFGFDSISNDYKMVRLVFLEGLDYYFEAPPLVEVYSLLSKCWRRVHTDMPHVVRSGSSSVVVNGVCHWVGGGGAKDNVIVCFDLHNEVFGEVPLPDCLRKEYFWELAVSEFEGSLVLVTISRTNDAGGFQGHETAAVWIMKEYGVVTSWTKLIDINDLKIDRRLTVVRSNGTVIVRSNGTVLLGTDCGLFIPYDPKEKIVYPTIRDCGGTFYLNAYGESLILLSEVNEFPLKDGFEDRLSKEHSNDDGVSKEYLDDDGGSKEGTSDDGVSEEASSDDEDFEEGSFDNGGSEEGSFDDGGSKEGSSDDGVLNDCSSDDGVPKKRAPSEDGSSKENLGEEKSE